MKKIARPSFMNVALKSMLVMAVLSACTKKRDAELPEDLQPSVFAISEFGEASENSPFSATHEDVDAASTDSTLKALDLSNAAKLSAEEVNVPAKMKYMFDRLPLSGQNVKNFKITFTVDKSSVTAYKVAQSVRELTILEKSLAITPREARLLTKLSKSSAAQVKALAVEQKAALAEREAIVSGTTEGALLVPLFKYDVAGYGIVERTKNDLKEQTAVLRLKDTDFANATHIQISDKSDARKMIGLNAQQIKEINQLFVASKLDNQVTTAGELAARLKIGLKFIDEKTKVLTKVGNDSLLIYEITSLEKLNESQKRALLNNAASERIKKCSDSDVVNAVQAKEASCVILLTGSVGLEHKKPELSMTDLDGATSSDISFKTVPQNQSTGLVEITENTPAEQIEVTNGLLDPNSTLKISDLQGEFFFRRTFEAAASSFLGRTGTSGDMVIVKFELEDDRLVVRNQMSLITYTGQGPKDREEVLSLPVTYYRYVTQNNNGVQLSLPKLEETSKEKAQYLKIDWTRNAIPDSTSPLAFYDAGRCFIANASQKVTATDMRLEKDGVLNFSLNSSYTVDPSCAAIKDVNSAYWSGVAQFNYNVQERLSFAKHTNKANTDQQFTLNISPMAQEAFNFGVFTLADRVTDTGKLMNRDGSEKYMPMVHDFRNGRVVRWYLGGINDSSATNAQRRKLLVEAAQQVMNEWNDSFRLAFKGTSLERAGNYVELIVEEPGKETGHLGDLDKNYIWFNEIPADNGLLGVAQPAANPRSGAIESANVIVYTGNTYEQTVALMKSTKLSRAYEKMIEEIKKEAVAKAIAEKKIITPNDLAKDAGKDNGAELGTKGKAVSQKIKTQLNLQTKALTELVKSLKLDQKSMRNALKDIKVSAALNSGVERKLEKDMFRNEKKGQQINYPLHALTINKKITELAMDKSLAKNPRELEFRINDLFLTYGGLSEQIKTALTKRQNALSMMLRFDRATTDRPGCFLYQRTEIEDHALTQDVNTNFKQAVMSTLSHELGHAFGLLHNFRGSMDKANYEFKGEQTGRNYSSIMDYISDIEQQYAGPGPYDVQAVRAAYTGYVPLTEAITSNPEQVKNLAAAGVKLIEGQFISIPDMLKVLNKKSLVHFTKDTLNSKGLLKHFEQCSDGGVAQSALCARFDVGGSAEEIVKNKIADYTRSYANRNYVYDRILFGFPQKIQIVQRNIMNFQEIRAYLDELLLTAINGSGRPDAVNENIMNDLVNASLLSYNFFQEVVRTPDTDKSISDPNRFTAIPYEYQVLKLDSQGQPIRGADGRPETEMKSDVKVLEARALYDKSLTKDKLETIGIGYDKIFAMNFLLQASAPNTTDDSQANLISFVDFEQFILGVKKPQESQIVQTIIDVLTNNLTAGFFAPSGEFVDTGMPVDINRFLADDTAVAAVIGLNQNKWQSFDLFAEAFKVGRATSKQAPSDRLNVVRFGQDRKLSDTTVYYPAQNAYAADAIIKQAARTETIMLSQAEVAPQLKALLTADSKVLEPIMQIVEKACAMNEDGSLKTPESCEAAQKKTVEQHLATMPELAANKKKADGEAKRLVGILRSLNKKEALMPKAADTPESRMNFEKQVEIARNELFLQTYTLKKVIQNLAEAPADQLQAVIQSVIPELQEVGKANEQLSSVPAMLFVQQYIYALSKDEVVNLTNGGQIKVEEILGLMIDNKKQTQVQMKLSDTLDKLSIFSRLVDADLTQTK